MALAKFQASQLVAKFQEAQELDNRIEALRKNGALIRWDKVAHQGFTVTYVGLEIIGHEDKIDEFKDWIDKRMFRTGKGSP